VRTCIGFATRWRSIPPFVARVGVHLRSGHGFVVTIEEVARIAAGATADP
jgi:hypothetical protein